MLGFSVSRDVHGDEALVGVATRLQLAFVGWLITRRRRMRLSCRLHSASYKESATANKKPNTVPAKNRFIESLLKNDRAHVKMVRRVFPPRETALGGVGKGQH